jgi:RNA polymerase sigma-70 factor, ECF subfamily
VSQLEADMRRRFDGGDLAGVATLALEHYGPEVFGYLCGLTHDQTDAADAFAELGHHLWRDLPRFRWEASLRSWMYRLAYHRFIALTREPERRPGRRVALSDAPEASALEAQARSITATFQRTDVKDAFARLRLELAVEDQTLLILRVDKALAWSEIAQVLDGVSEAALRKRFERIKSQLRERARAAGLR